MASDDVERILRALEGTHRLSRGERADIAIRRFYIVMVGVGALLLPLVVLAVQGITADTSTHWTRGVLYTMGYGIVVGGALLLALRMAAIVYVVDEKEIRSVKAWPIQGWAVDRHSIETATLVRRMFYWQLHLGLRDGQKKAVRLPRSMCRALGLREPVK